MSGQAVYKCKLIVHYANQGFILYFELSRTLCTLWFQRKPQENSKCIHNLQTMQGSKKENTSPKKKMNVMAEKNNELVAD